MGLEYRMGAVPKRTNESKEKVGGGPLRTGHSFLRAVISSSLVQAVLEILEFFGTYQVLPCIKISNKSQTFLKDSLLSSYSSFAICSCREILKASKDALLSIYFNGCINCFLKPHSCKAPCTDAIHMQTHQENITMLPSI